MSGRESPTDDLLRLGDVEPTLGLEATSERDAVKTRAVLVTFFDETLPAIIDRAEQSGLAEISE